MASIEIFAGKLGLMPGLIGNLSKSVTDYRTELAAFGANVHAISGEHLRH